jgi:hypothetical protein
VQAMRYDVNSFVERMRSELGADHIQRLQDFKPSVDEADEPRTMVRLAKNLRRALSCRCGLCRRARLLGAEVAEGRLRDASRACRKETHDLERLDGLVHDAVQEFCQDRPHRVR